MEETEVKLNELELKTLLAFARHQESICHKVSAYQIGGCPNCTAGCLMRDLRDKLRQAKKKLAANSRQS